MDIHPKFATWLASANITPADETLRKWWTGLAAFEATGPDVISLVQLANGADASTISASRFHATLQTQDAALLPSQKLAVAALAAAKLHTIVESKSTFGDLAALLSAINFPLFETQPAYRSDLATLAENSLTNSSRARADLNALVIQLEQKSGAALKTGELERILATTAEETNILWWIFGGRSRDTNETFAEFADDVIPLVAAKELADLTTILPGHVGIAAFADRVCQTGRTKLPQSLVVSTAIKNLPDGFATAVSSRWRSHICLPLCRLTQEIVNRAPGWSKSHKMRTVDLSRLFYRECLVPRAWQKVSS